MNSAAFIWARTLQYLKDRLGGAAVSAWLDDAEVVGMDQRRLILYSPSQPRRSAIRSSCKSHIEAALRELFGLERELVVWDRREPMEEEQDLLPIWRHNPQFSFQNFVADPLNLASLRAAIHAAEQPGDPACNPLYLYGPPGVGKTHLLTAIGNQASQLHPQLRVVYIKGEEFTSHLIQAILYSRTEAFRKKYREADILLVDDIQFIAGKKATQEEFFHTFNHLFKLHKQIVLVSDRKPGDMAALEDRLKRRFGAGILLELQMPGPGTRMEIIRLKAADLGLKLDEETVGHMARTLDGSVRQIEGALRRLRAFHDLSGMELTLPNVARTIQEAD